MKEELKKLLLNNQIEELKNNIRELLKTTTNKKELDELYAFLYLIFSFENNYEIANKFLSFFYYPNEILVKISSFLQDINKYDELNNLLMSFKTNTVDIKSIKDKELFLYEILKKDDNNEYIIENIFAGKDNYNDRIKEDKDDIIENINYIDINTFDLNIKDIYKDIDSSKHIIENIEKDNLLAIELLSNLDNNTELNDNNNFEEIYTNDAIIIKDEDISNKTSIKKNDEKISLLFTMYDWYNITTEETRFQKEFIKKLVNYGYKITVFFAASQHKINKTPYYMEYSEEDGVELLGVYNRPSLFLDIDNPLREIKDENVVELFEYVISKSKPDIITFYSFNGLSFEIANVAKRLGIKTIYEPFNYYLIDPLLYMYNGNMTWKNTNLFENSILPNRFPMLNKEYKERIIASKKLLNEIIDYTFVGSNRAKSIFSEFIEWNNKNLFTINHIDTKTIEIFNQKDNFIKENKELHFAFIGDILSHTGINILIQAIQLLKDYNIKFDIYGKCSDEYKNTIKLLDKNNAITIYDNNFSFDELLKIACDITFIIIPNIWEDPTSFIVSDYLALGLPVIASNVGGVSDYIIDGNNGILFESNNPKALASVIRAVIDNPFKIDNMKLQCHNNYKVCFEDYILHKTNLYNSIYNNKYLSQEDIEFLFIK